MVSYSISLYFIPEVEALKNQKGASSHVSVRYLFGMWRSAGRHICENQAFIYTYSKQKTLSFGNDLAT